MSSWSIAYLYRLVSVLLREAAAARSGPYLTLQQCGDGGSLFRYIQDDTT